MQRGILESTLKIMNLENLYDGSETSKKSRRKHAESLPHCPLMMRTHHAFGRIDELLERLPPNHHHHHHHHHHHVAKQSPERPPSQTELKENAESEQPSQSQTTSEELKIVTVQPAVTRFFRGQPTPVSLPGDVVPEDCVRVLPARFVEQGAVVYPDSAFDIIERDSDTPCSDITVMALCVEEMDAHSSTFSPIPYFDSAPKGPERMLPDEDVVKPAQTSVFQYQELKAYLEAAKSVKEPRRAKLDAASKLKDIVGDSRRYTEYFQPRRARREKSVDSLEEAVEAAPPRRKRGRAKKSVPPPDDELCETSEKQDAYVDISGWEAKAPTYKQPINVGGKRYAMYDCFEEVAHSSGFIVRPMDTVSVNVDDSGVNIAKIAHIYYNAEEEAFFASIFWYYRAPQLPASTYKEGIYAEKEIFASSHADRISLASIIEPVVVLTYNEWTRYNAENKMEALPAHLLQNFAPCWRRAEDNYHRRHRNPADDTSEDVVFFCRFVYLPRNDELEGLQKKTRSRFLKMMNLRRRNVPSGYRKKNRGRARVRALPKGCRIVKAPELVSLEKKAKQKRKVS